MIVVAPQYFLDKKPEPDVLDVYKKWDKKVYEQLYEARNKALKALADYYFEMFHFTRENANRLSENGLTQILSAASDFTNPSLLPDNSDD
jgi:hypothetical protein